MNNWKEEFKKVNQCDQRQDALNNQLKDLVIIANRFGFFDAADYLEAKYADSRYDNKLTKV